MAHGVGIPGKTGHKAEACRAVLRDSLEILDVATDKNAELGQLVESVSASLYRFDTWTVSIRKLYKTDLNKSFDPLLYSHGIRRDLCDEVLRLLDQLQTFLEDLMQILNGTRQQRTWVKSLTRAPPSDMDLSSSEDSDSEFGAYIRKIKEGTADPQTVTESNELCRCIDDTITSLLRIAMQVDDSLLNSKFDLCQLKDSDFIEPDIMHVREKFPWAKGNEPLVRKLGRANAQRRKWLESRRQGCESPLYQSHLDSKALKTYANYQKDSSSSTATVPTTSDSARQFGADKKKRRDNEGYCNGLWWVFFNENG